MTIREDMAYSAWGETPASSRAGYQIHTVRAPDFWAYPEHGHRGFCEFVYVTQGSVRQVINGTELSQDAGELLLIREHDCHALSGTDFAYVNIMFQTDWLRRMEQFTQLPGQTRRLREALHPPLAMVPLGQRHALQELLEALHAAHTHDSGRLLFAHFMTMALGRHLSPATDHNGTPDLPDWLQNTVTWIHQHHDTVPPLKDVISYSCRCQEHFTRQFSLHLGLSPSRYLGALRIDRAASLLATTNFPVQQICEQLGFENESYFYRLFRQHKQTTPLAYRRAHGPRSIQKRG